MEPVLLRSLISMGILGVLLGAGLAFASKKFIVEVDPRIEAIEELLPGANCGACGFPGCANFAEAVVSSQVSANGCVVGGAGIVDKISQIMGVESAGAVIPKKALLRCGGTCEKALDRGKYSGIEDCRAATLLGGGTKACSFGCLGLGTCVDACPFKAIEMGDDGLPIVNKNICTGCGICVDICPKNLFTLVPETSDVHVLCASTMKGASVRKVCSAGCIGCKRCEKVCDTGAISVTDFLASIDYEKCTTCGKCAENCPTSCIIVLSHQERGLVEVDDIAH